MSAHTRFPKLSVHGLAIYTDDGKTFIAQGITSDADIATNDYERKTGVPYADAKEMMELLASAPELLAALEACLPELPHSAEGARDVLHPVLSRARAAIARATGGDESTPTWPNNPELRKGGQP